MIKEKIDTFIFECITKICISASFNTTFRYLKKRLLECPPGVFNKTLGSLIFSVPELVYAAANAQKFLDQSEIKEMTRIALDLLEKQYHAFQRYKKYYKKTYVWYFYNDIAGAEDELVRIKFRGWYGYGEIIKDQFLPISLSIFIETLKTYEYLFKRIAESIKDKSTLMTEKETIKTIDRILKYSTKNGKFIMSNEIEKKVKEEAVNRVKRTYPEYYRSSNGATIDNFR